jgi:hypothetical protein
MNANSVIVGLSVLIGVAVALSLTGTEGALAGFLALLLTLMLGGAVPRRAVRA